ncbi:Kunitz-type trypsin inhibitor-like 1 protein, partial [Mucuna pruriens]
MKGVLVLTLSFLLGFLSNLPLGFSDDGLVRDTNGNTVAESRKYYIKPGNENPAPRGGGIRLALTENTDCPVTVFQAYSEAVRGIPVYFHVPYPVIPGRVHTEAMLLIEFTKKPKCVSAPYTFWSFFEDKTMGKAYLGIGGPDDHPGDKRRIGRFYIKKHGSGYKLIFCDAGTDNCSYVGRYDDVENGIRLVLTPDQPFQFVIVDASSNSHGTIKSVV